MNTNIQPFLIIDNFKGHTIAKQKHNMKLYRSVCLVVSSTQNVKDNFLAEFFSG